MPHHEGGAHAEQAGPPPLNRLIFAGSSVIHREAERRPFQVKFLKAELPRDAYTEYLAQLSFVYSALEDVDWALKDDDVVGRMFSPELHRHESIDADMTFFAGEGWRSKVEPSPATQRYVERLRWAQEECPPAFVSHQWLRYLGNVLGQHVLHRIMRKAYGLTSDEGMRFYVYDKIADPKAYLGEYHARMNSMPLDDATKRIVVEEGNKAFQLQIELSDELGARFGIGEIDAEETEKILSDLAAEHG
jgi:heme oxygenase